MTENSAIGPYLNRVFVAMDCPFLPNPLGVRAPEMRVGFVAVQMTVIHIPEEIYRTKL